MKQENRLLTIDGETLMSQPLAPLNFVVDTLLSQGLHILAGSPKVGKSWLALWLAVTVAKGEAVWGMGVKQGTTLYLCLEDSTLRIQNRLFEITEDAPANVHFSTNSDTLGKGLEEQLCAFLVEHPDTVLVIIDTLQMIRGAGYDNTYANDYDRMIAKREEQITEAKKQIEELQNISEMLRSRQAKLKRDISLIDDILREGKMSEAHLRMLVEKILVHEEDGKLDLDIRLKAPFRDHLDIFENGEQTDCIPSMDFDYDRLGAAIYGDYYVG